MKSAVFVCLLATSLCTAQSFLDRAWRPDTRPHVPRPPVSASQEVINQLQDLQARTLSLSRKAEYNGDFEAALAAAWQARANLELLLAVSSRTEATAAPLTSSPIFTVAFTDRTIREVRAFWTVDQTTSWSRKKAGSSRFRPAEWIGI